MQVSGAERLTHGGLRRELLQRTGSDGDVPVSTEVCGHRLQRAPFKGRERR